MIPAYPHPCPACGGVVRYGRIDAPRMHGLDLIIAVFMTVIFKAAPPMFMRFSHRCETCAVEFDPALSLPASCFAGAIFLVIFFAPLFSFMFLYKFWQIWLLGVVAYAVAAAWAWSRFSRALHNRWGRLEKAAPTDRA